METPTLTKKQLQSTLSSKKKKKLVCIKNVLATPYDPFWPLVDEPKLKSIHAQLNNLPRVKLPKFSVPWNELKNIPRELRKDFREEYNKKLFGRNLQPHRGRAHLCIGINDVSKHLENNRLLTVLIHALSGPTLLVQHLIDQAVARKVPVLVIRDLKNLLLKNCGFSGTALGIKKSAIEIKGLMRLVETVTDIARQYPIPESRLQTVDAPNRTVAEPVVKAKEAVDEDEIRRSCYLRRESKGVRAFVPKNKDKGITVEHKKVTEINPAEPLRKRKLKRAYIPLKVKRVKGNPNRRERVRVKKQVKKLR